MGLHVLSTNAVITNTSGTNSGDVAIASVAEINTGTDNVKTISALGLAGSQLQIDVTANNAKVTNAAHTGDVTGATALTIAADAVTNAKLADMGANTIKGNNTGGAANPTDLIGSDVFTLIGLSTEAAPTVVDATVIDATYDATEEAVLNNVRTRLNEVIAAMQANGLMS